MMKTMLLSLAAALLLLAVPAAQAEAGGSVPMDWRSLSYSKSAMCYDYSFSFYVYRDSKGDRRVCCNFLDSGQGERCELERALVTRKERAEIDQLEKVVNLLAWDIVEPKQPDDGCVALDADECSLELEMDSQAVFTAELTVEQEKELRAALQALCKKLLSEGTDERM